MQQGTTPTSSVSPSSAGRRKVEFAQSIEPGDTSIKGPICGCAERSEQSRTGVMDPESSQIDQDPGRRPRAEKSRDDITDRSDDRPYGIPGPRVGPWICRTAVSGPCPVVTVMPLATRDEVVTPIMSAYAATKPPQPLRSAAPRPQRPVASPRR